MNKRRQQGRDGATPKIICPKCGEAYLKASMEWVSTPEGRRLRRFGQHCPNCSYDVRD